jgi:hypothetical protein
MIYKKFCKRCRLLHVRGYKKYRQTNCIQRKQHMQTEIKFLYRNIKLNINGQLNLYKYENKMNRNKFELELM